MIWNYRYSEEVKDSDSLLELLLTHRLADGASVRSREKFLQPQLTDIHSYSLLSDIDAAVDRILQAVEDKEQIYIHGDFDVDGVSATAILWDLLYREAGAKVLPYIPSRFEEGYGLTEASITAMKEGGASLVITVDCGIRDQELIAKHDDLDFIVTDHHTIPVNENGEPAPPAAARAVVHPGHPEYGYPFRDICGANVAWKLSSAIADTLGLEVDMYKYLDLVALATVCDIMPLVDENRVIVKYGLERLSRTQNVGLLSLLEASAVEPAAAETYHFGYVLGPRINAAGRIDSAMQALKLLTTKDKRAAISLAQELSSLNTERQELTQKLFKEAEAQIAQQPADSRIFIIHGDHWPEGILGLAAGKLTEKYHRPVIVLSNDGEKMVGSARSTSSFHMANALEKLTKLLLRHGGHAQAAGLTLHPNQFSEFNHQMMKLAQTDIQPEDLQKNIHIDAPLDSSICTLDLHYQVQTLAPFGFGNAQPTIALHDLKLLSADRIGKQKSHLRLKVSADNNFSNSIAGIGFNYHNIEAVEALVGKKVNLAARLDANTWNGNTSLQLKLVDVVGA